MTLKANLGVDRRYDKNKSYVPNTTVAGAAKGGIANILQRDNIDYLMELTANYTKDFGNHSLTALVILINSLIKKAYMPATKTSLQMGFFTTICRPEPELSLM